MALLLSETLALPGGPAPVQWRRSARARRVSLRIDPRAGAVVVTLPPRAARSAGLSLLMSHADWVAERLRALPGAVRFADGTEIPLAGALYRIRHMPAARGGAWISGQEIQVAGDAAFLARRVTDFLRAEAAHRLGELASGKAQAAGLKLRRVSVKDTRSRWGSCAPDGTLSFSWRLVMAPDFVQDYVAAHEVAHLRHMNHGARFWALVAELTPHRAAADAWLHRQGPQLLRIG